MKPCARLRFLRSLLSPARALQSLKTNPLIEGEAGTASPPPYEKLFVCHTGAAGVLAVIAAASSACLASRSATA